MTRFAILAVSIVMSAISGVARCENPVDAVADFGFTVRQNPDTQTLLTQYLSGLPAEADTVYAVVFPPANCPRCEASINRIDYFVKKYTSAPTVLIAVYPDRDAAASYCARNGFIADHYIYDTADSISRILSFSCGYLHVPYVLKLSRNFGRLIVGANSTDVGPAFFEALACYDAPKAMQRYVRDNPLPPVHPLSDTIAPLTPVADLALDTGPDICLSQTDYPVEFSGDMLMVNDKLLNAVQVFRRDGERMRRVGAIAPDSAECRHFSQLPDTMFCEMDRSGSLKYIPLTPFALSDTVIGVGYSLPALFEVEGGIGYMNAPCILRRDSRTLAVLPLAPLRYDFDDGYFYPHFTMRPFADKVVIGCERLTWPVVQDSAEYSAVDSLNPFAASYYDVRHPILSAWSVVDGRLCSRFGALPDFSGKARLGSYLLAPVFACNGDEACWSDGVSGEVRVVPSDSLDCTVESYTLFPLSAGDMPDPDPARFYSYDCATAYEPYLDRMIHALRLTDSAVHAIVRYGKNVSVDPIRESRYTYVRVDRRSGERSEMSFPSDSAFACARAFGLTSGASACRPFMLYAAPGGQWRVALF